MMNQKSDNAKMEEKTTGQVSVAGGKEDSICDGDA